MPASAGMTCGAPLLLGFARRFLRQAPLHGFELLLERGHFVRLEVGGQGVLPEFARLLPLRGSLPRAAEAEINFAEVIANGGILRDARGRFAQIGLRIAQAVLPAVGPAQAVEIGAVE